MWKKHLAILLLIGLVFIASGIGLRDPWPSDEPRFALVAKEMVESGDWFFPTRGGELYPDKPPLFMWAQAAFYELTGSLRVAFLLPSLLAGLITLLLVYDAGRRFWGSSRIGFYAGLLLLATPQFVLESRAGQLDALVTAWVALGLYGFLRHLLQGPDWKWFYIAFAACGFGIITKGVGFLPLLLFIPWLWARQRGHWQYRPRPPVWPHSVLGPLVMVLAIASWLVPMLILVAKSGDPSFEAYRDNILFKQTGERYVAPSHHFKPGWYFPVEVMPSLWLPLFLLSPWLLPAWWRRMRRGDARFTLLLGWATLVVLFFSLSPAKRGVYILPALPWVCLAAAPLLSGLVLKLRGLEARRLIPVTIGLAALALGIVLRFLWPEGGAALAGRYEEDPVPGILFFGAGILLATLPPRINARLVPGLFGTLLTLAGAALLWIRPEKNAELIERYEVNAAPSVLACGLAILLLLALFRRRPAMSWLGMMGALWLTYGLLLGPAADQTKSGRGLMLDVERQLGPDTPLALVDWKEQIILQAQRPTENFGFLVPLEEQVQRGIAWLEKHPEGRILIQGRALEPCFDPATARLVDLAHRREWFLVSLDDVTEECGGN